MTVFAFSGACPAVVMVDGRRECLGRSMIRRPSLRQLAEHYGHYVAGRVTSSVDVLVASGRAQDEPSGNVRRARELYIPIWSYDQFFTYCRIPESGHGVPVPSGGMVTGRLTGREQYGVSPAQSVLDGLESVREQSMTLADLVQQSADAVVPESQYAGRTEVRSFRGLGVDHGHGDRTIVMINPSETVLADVSDAIDNAFDSEDTVQRLGRALNLEPEQMRNNLQQMIQSRMQEFTREQMMNALYGGRLGGEKPESEEVPDGPSVRGLGPRLGRLLDL